MDAWLAYTLAGVFVLFQALPLAFAFRGKASAWVFTQSSFGVAMFALASVQYNGRGTWAVLAATTGTMIVISVLSALLALIGYHWRAHRPRIANLEVF